MKKSEKFILSGALLAATSLLIRFVGVGFNVYVTNKLGAAGMGLITLINSVYGFAITLATSGINLSATRLCSAAIGKGSHRQLRVAMKKCITYAIFFGVLAMCLLFFFAEPIARGMLKDERTALSLKFLSPALPCIAISSALNGYFTSVRRVYKNAAAVVFEQSVKIILIINALTLLLPKGIEYSCVAVIGGGAVSEMLSFCFSFVMYLIDRKKHIGNRGEVEAAMGKKLLSIAMPVASTAYVRSGLLTIEHLLIPRGLERYGATKSVALSIYGIVQAMALPVVLFPQAILAAFNGLIIPELSEAMAREDRAHIDRVSEKWLKATLVFASLSSILIFAFASDLGMTVYNQPHAGGYIRIFALLIPVMYLDSAVDSILKGMGEQVYSMKVNILDAGLSTLLVYLLLPHFGINGYVGIIFVCEMLNTGLSIARLRRIASVKVDWLRALILPMFSTAGGVMITRLVLGFIPFFSCFGVVQLTVGFVLALILSAFFILTTGAVTVGEIAELFRSKRKKTVLRGRTVNIY